MKNKFNKKLQGFKIIVFKAVFEHGLLKSHSTSIKKNSYIFVDPGVNFTTVLLTGVTVFK